MFPPADDEADFGAGFARHRNSRANARHTAMSIPNWLAAHKGLARELEQHTLVDECLVRLGSQGRSSRAPKPWGLP